MFLENFIHFSIEYQKLLSWKEKPMDYPQSSNPNYWDEVIGSKKAGQFLGLSQTTIYQLTIEGRIKSISWGRQRRYTRRALRESLENIQEYCKPPKVSKLLK